MRENSTQDELESARPPHSGETPQDPLSRWIIPLGLPFAIVFVFVTLFTFYEVMMRYFFNSPTMWVHETTTAMTAICFAFGGVYCLASDRHIRVVLIYDALSPSLRKWVDVAISVVGFIACALMAWAASGLAYKALYAPDGRFRLETSGSAWNPPTPAIVKSFLFIMLCVMCVQFLLQTVRHLRRPGTATAERRPGATEESAGDV
ncbi:C4-dicarboxylate ABC transporter permease [Roseivivax halodurans JCM 10272]|uniref:TRAP transporter small permease protein n=1 Tax=Roseivivax halodurans JCM 10272 TaxID=1449350 RepID=X7EJH9_9RHOB|nr:TRAP transporter small permease [Roseivivax halodurans]ETX16035.1 C4-dicarboxylate ABC transporter permease [Roseivivax halodurans JCM 10272]